MGEFIANYNQHKANKFQNANIEFEIRHTKLPQKLFIMYNNYINKSGESTRLNTINTIYDDVVKTITYHDDGKRSEVSGTKKSLGSYDVGNGFKVNISQETALTYETISNSGALLRIKTRRSLPIDIDGVTWRLDITIVKQIPSNDAKNAKVYSKLLFEPEYTQLANNTNNDPQYHYEAEFELINGKLTEQIFRKALHLFKSITNPHSESDISATEYLKFVDNLINKDVGNKFKKPTPTIKSILPNVSSLTKNNYRLMYDQMVGFYMTDKAEGIRSLLILKDKKCCIVNSSLKVIDTVVNEPDVYILDGEYIKDINLFLAFDAIHCADKPFNERIIAINAAVDVISKYTPCKAKKFYKIEKLDDIKSHYDSIMSAKADYGNDGIIFTSCDKNYKETKNLKWKPVEHNTIDFLVKKLPEKHISEGKYYERPGFDIYLLFVGITRQQYDQNHIQLCIGYKDIFDMSQFTTYMPIHFAVFNSPYAYIYYYPTTNSEPIDGKIIELFADNIDGLVPTWRLINIREDRDIDLSGGNYFGNNYNVAESVWLNYMDPFPETELWNPSSTYFDTDKMQIYEGLTKFINEVKSSAINDLKGSNTIIDIGCGKGQDIHKYTKASIAHLIAVDRDKSALSELIARRNKIKNNTMKIFAISHDININAHSDIQEEGFIILKTELEEKYNITACNAIVCNLAVHYVDKLERFAMFCADMVKQSGYVLITCFSGERIHELFEKNNIKNGESWMHYKDGILKYQLERRYDGDLGDENSKIGVLLPFSKGKLYEENLVNINYLLTLFTRNAFRVDYCESLEKELDKYNTTNPNNELGDDDAKYASLYYKIVLCRL